MLRSRLLSNCRDRRMQLTALKRFWRWLSSTRCVHGPGSPAGLWLSSQAGWRTTHHCMQSQIAASLQKAAVHCRRLYWRHARFWFWLRGRVSAATSSELPFASAALQTSLTLATALLGHVRWSSCSSCNPLWRCRDSHDHVEQRTLHSHRSACGTNAFGSLRADAASPALTRAVDDSRSITTLSPVSSPQQLFARQCQLEPKRFATARVPAWMPSRLRSGRLSLRKCKSAQPAADIAPVLSPQARVSPDARPCTAPTRQTYSKGRAARAGLCIKQERLGARCALRKQAPDRIAAYWNSGLRTSQTDDYPLPILCAEPALRDRSHSPHARSARRHRGKVLPPPAAMGGAVTTPERCVVRHPVSSSEWGELGERPAAQRPAVGGLASGGGYQTPGMGDGSAAACTEQTRHEAEMLHPLGSADACAMNRFLAALDGVPEVEPTQASWSATRSTHEVTQPHEPKSGLCARLPAGPAQNAVTAGVAAMTDHADWCSGAQGGFTMSHCSPGNTAQHGGSSPIEIAALRDRADTAATSDISTSQRGSHSAEDWRAVLPTSSIAPKASNCLQSGHNRHTQELGCLGRQNDSCQRAASCATSLSLPGSSRGSAIGSQGSRLEVPPSAAAALEPTAPHVERAFDTDKAAAFLASCKTTRSTQSAGASHDAFQVALLAQLNSALQVRVLFMCVSTAEPTCLGRDLYEILMQNR